MRKVLIISYHFSDKAAIAAVRINGLAKFLQKFGWEPFILTALSNAKPNSKIQVFETHCEDTRLKWKRKLGLNVDNSLQEELNLVSLKNKNNPMESVIKLWEEIFAYPDFVSGWRKPAVNFANKLINSECIDAIISSSGPPTCNLIAKDLKEKHDIPWIADFRDLWTQNHYYQYSRFRHFFETKLELRSLSSADALTTVSQPLVVKLKQLHPAKKIFSIPNGFDPLQKNPGLPLPRQFTITYTGSLYRGKRDPEPLFQVLGEIVSNGLVDPNDLSVEFYGPREDWLKDEAKRYGLNGIVKINGAISRDASIEKQRRSHLLLLLTWDKPEEKGVYTGKVFDYLAAGRPILSMGISGGVVEDLLKCTGAGFHVSSQEDLKRIILNTYQEYKSTSTINYHGSVSEIDRFSHVEMARKFSAVLDELVKP